MDINHAMLTGLVLCWENLTVTVTGNSMTFITIFCYMGSWRFLQFVAIIDFCDVIWLYHQLHNKVGTSQYDLTGIWGTAQMLFGVESSVLINNSINMSTPKETSAFVIFVCCRASLSPRITSTPWRMTRTINLPYMRDDPHHRPGRPIYVCSLICLKN